MARGFDTFSDMFNQLENKPTASNEKKEPAKNKNNKNKQSSTSRLKDNINKQNSETLDSTNLIKQSDETITLNNNIKQYDETLNINKNDEQSDEIINIHNDEKQLDEPLEININNNDEILDNNVTTRVEALLGFKKQPTVLETHSRYSVLIRKDLLERLDKLAKKQDRGFKTRVFNTALETILDEMESILK